MNSFAKSVDILHRAMGANVVRRNVIADNMANATTPGFKRSMVNFESELKRALNSEKQRPALELTLADPRHIPNHREKDYRDVQIRRVLEYNTTYNNNGNNVDPEKEAADALQTQMVYSLLTRSMNFEFNQLNQALRR
jgi:flagellar basal-body rod protein FlgB